MLVWLSFALLMLAVGLSRAARSHDDGDELTAFTLVGLTANVISPISWSHHLVFVIPAVMVLADAAMRRRDASRGMPRRGLAPSAGMSGFAPLRTPIWFPALTGLRHAARGGQGLRAVPDLTDLAVRAPAAVRVPLRRRAVGRPDGELVRDRADHPGGVAALAAGRRAGVLPEPRRMRRFAVRGS